MTTADEARQLLSDLGVNCAGSLESRSSIDGQLIGSVPELRPQDSAAIAISCCRSDARLSTLVWDKASSVSLRSTLGDALISGPTHASMEPLSVLRNLASRTDSASAC